MQTWTEGGIANPSRNDLTGGAGQGDPHPGRRVRPPVELHPGLQQDQRRVQQRDDAADRSERRRRRTSSTRRSPRSTRSSSSATQRRGRQPPAPPLTQTGGGRMAAVASPQAGPCPAGPARASGDPRRSPASCSSPSRSSCSSSSTSGRWSTPRTSASGAGACAVRASSSASATTSSCFGDPIFWKAVTNTLYYVAIWSCRCTMALGLFLAVIVNQETPRPDVLPGGVLLPDARELGRDHRRLVLPASQPDGLFNAAREALGLNPFFEALGFEPNYNWLGQLATAMNAIILLNAWTTSGTVMLFYLTFLQTISRRDLRGRGDRRRGLRGRRSGGSRSRCSARPTSSSRRCSSSAAPSCSTRRSSPAAAAASRTTP